MTGSEPQAEGDAERAGHDQLLEDPPPGYHDITVAAEGNVEVVTIARPDAMNALTPATHAELEDAVRSSTARCLILTGADPAFCAGDTTDPAPAPPPPPTELAASPDGDRRTTPLADALLTTNIPVIAAVNGAAAGWGMELALLADIRVASNRATFGDLFVTRGLNCDVAGLGRLAGLVGRERAAELLFTGAVVSADDARAIGLVSRVVAHDDLAETAMGLAQRIAHNPPLAVQAMKHGLRTALDPDWNQLGQWVAASLAQLVVTEDHREGVASLAEDRPPTFLGR